MVAISDFGCAVPLRPGSPSSPSGNRNIHLRETSSRYHESHSSHVARMRPGVRGSGWWKASGASHWPHTSDSKPVSACHRTTCNERCTKSIAPNSPTLARHRLATLRTRPRSPFVRGQIDGMHALYVCAIPLARGAVMGNGIDLRCEPISSRARPRGGLRRMVKHVAGKGAGVRRRESAGASWFKIRAGSSRPASPEGRRWPLGPGNARRRRTGRACRGGSRCRPDRSGGRF